MDHSPLDLFPIDGSDKTHVRSYFLRAITSSAILSNDAPSIVMLPCSPRWHYDGPTFLLHKLGCIRLGNSYITRLSQTVALAIDRDLKVHNSTLKAVFWTRCLFSQTVSGMSSLHFYRGLQSLGCLRTLASPGSLLFIETHAY